MIASTATPAEVSPEVAAALDRLDRCDPLLVSDALRQRVLSAAESAAFAREAQTYLTACGEAVQAELVARDLSGAAIAAAELAAAERLVPLLPKIEDDRVGEDDLALAGRLIEVAWSAIPPSPTLSAQAELDAFRSLPPRLQSTVEPPSVTREDRQLQTAINDWSRRQRETRDQVASWRRAVELQSSDALALLSDVRRLVDICEATAHDAGVLSALVAEANTRRHVREDEWLPTSAAFPVDRFITAQTTALAAHRQRMAAVAR
jgi:hypothetical protein